MTIPATAVVSDHLERRSPDEPALLAAKADEVHLDPDLEQQQDDADVGEQLELAPVGDEARGERGDGQTERQVPDDRRQPDTPGRPAERRGSEEQEADLEDRWRGVHQGMVSGSSRVPVAVGRAPGLHPDRAGDAAAPSSRLIVM